MTRDEIIEIAQQVTKEFDYLWCNNMPELERFADLVEQRANAWRPASEPPEDSLPHAYLLKKLAMVMPLFEEARDALTAISEQQRAVRCISPTLADRMDMAGTYSIDDWRDVEPPTTEGE
jgi:hypothetical protein